MSASLAWFIRTLFLCLFQVSLQFIMLLPLHLTVRKSHSPTWNSPVNPHCSLDLKSLASEFLRCWPLPAATGWLPPLASTPTFYPRVSWTPGRSWLHFVFLSSLPLHKSIRDARWKWPLATSTWINFSSVFKSWLKRHLLSGVCPHFLRQIRASLHTAPLNSVHIISIYYYNAL